MEHIKRVTQELRIPSPLEVNFAAIPEVLKARSQWVVWTYRMQEGEIKKPPLSPKTGKLASVGNPDTWESFEDARKAYETGRFAGVGFVLTSGIVGIDVDHCIQEGRMNEDALRIAVEGQTYTELSPSGAGLHLLMEGSLPGRYRREGTVEMYETGRYLTVTGQSIVEPPWLLSSNQHRLNAIYHHIFPQPKQTENTVGGGRAAPNVEVPYTAQMRKC